MYKASQIPVEKLRYPRAVKSNNNNFRRSGIEWFTRHAAPKKTDSNVIENITGLQTLWTEGKLEKKAGNSQLKAQHLQQLDKNDSNTDLLFGYDGLGISRPLKNNKTVYDDIEPFDQTKHIHDVGKSGENTSQNQNTRKQERKNRN